MNGNISKDAEQVAVRLYTEGYSVLGVSQTTGLSIGTVQQIVKEYGVGRTFHEAQKMRSGDSEWATITRQHMVRCPSEETRRRISLTETGKRLSKATRKRISVSRLKMHYQWRGWHHTEESKENLRRKGRIRRHTPEVKERIANSMRTYILQLSPEEQIERARKWIRAAGTKPNGGEQALYNILQKHFPEQWKYVGKGDFVIGGKIPDFVNINGEKQVIEFFREHWHKPADVEIRTKHFKEFGFRTLIIWARELHKEETLVEKVRQWSSQ